LITLVLTVKQYPGHIFFVMRNQYFSS